jgi:hypothetical protein
MQMATMRRLKPSEYGESDDSLLDREVDDFEYDSDTDTKKSSSAATRTRNLSTSTSSFERGRTAHRPPPRTYFPSLHLPQPLNMNGVVGNLASISRARSRSNSPAPARYPPPPIIEGISSAAGVDADGNVFEGKKAPMDDVAAVKPLKQSTRGAGDRSKPSRPKPSLACIEAHLGHAVWDIAGSLLGFAVVVNSCILILGTFFPFPFQSLIIDQY